MTNVLPAYKMSDTLSSTRQFYANLFRIQTTKRELVLEFASYFPASEEEAENVPPITPEVRVVLPIDAFRALSEALASFLPELESSAEGDNL